MTDPREEWAFLGDSVLHVSRFPPAQDGIARYAGQLDAILAPGRRVLRLGIPLGGGDRVRALWGGVRPLRIALHARGYGEVLVEYHPDYFVRGSWLNRLASYAALAAVSRLRRTTWIVHEADPERAVEIGRRGKAQFAVEEWLRRRLWGRAGALVFHSEWERRCFAQRFPGDRREHVVTHGSFFTPEATASRGEARRALGLDPDAALLLCIGFLSPHKGYERVIACFERAAIAGAQLHIVGSAIRPTPDVEEHVAHLHRLAAATPGIELHETFVSDEDFDRWIRAADAVLTPYHESSSSGVMARAHMLGARVITSAAGGMAEQASPDDLRFGTDEELVEALRAVAAQRRARSS
jgi:glycosyltransferase involved in cell wall biosynthesis